MGRWSSDGGVAIQNGDPVRREKVKSWRGAHQSYLLVSFALWIQTSKS